MNFKKGKLYWLQEYRARPLWRQNTDYNNEQLAQIPDGGIVMILGIKTIRKNYNETHWIKVIYQDLVGFMVSGFPRLEDLFHEHSIEEEEGTTPGSLDQKTSEL